MCMTFGCNPQINLSMILHFYSNDDCAVVNCIGRISFLDMKLIVCQKKSLFLFEIALNDIWIL